MQDIVLWPKNGPVKLQSECENQKKQRLVSSPAPSFLKMPWVGSAMVMRRIGPRTTAGLAACYFKDKQLLCQGLCRVSRHTCGPDVNVTCAAFKCVWPRNSRKWHHLRISPGLSDIIQSLWVASQVRNSSDSSRRALRRLENRLCLIQISYSKLHECWSMLISLFLPLF